jgi:hypothetical protein
VAAILPPIPDRRVLLVYGNELGQGYSMVGTVPSSLSFGKTKGSVPWLVTLSSLEYLLMRMLITWVIALTVTFALSLQACLLGMLATRDDGESPAPPVPAGESHQTAQ